MRRGLLMARFRLSSLLIAPLYGGKSAHEMLSLFSETPEKSSFESVRDYWQAKHTGADYETLVEAFGARRLHQKTPLSGGERHREVGPCDRRRGSKRIRIRNLFPQRSLHSGWSLCEQRVVAGIAAARFAFDLGQRGHRQPEDGGRVLNVTDEDQAGDRHNGHTVWGAVWRVPGAGPDGSIGLSLELLPQHGRGARVMAPASTCIRCGRHPILTSVGARLYAS